MSLRPLSLLPAASSDDCTATPTPQARALGRNLEGFAVWELEGQRRLGSQPPELEDATSASSRFLRSAEGAAQRAALAFWAFEDNLRQGPALFFSHWGDAGQEAAQWLGFGFAHVFGARLAGREGEAGVEAARLAWERSGAGAFLLSHRQGQPASLGPLAHSPWLLEASLRIAQTLAGSWRPLSVAGVAPLWPVELFSGLRYCDQTLPTHWPQEWRAQCPLPLAQGASREDSLFFAVVSSPNVSPREAIDSSEASSGSSAATAQQAAFLAVLGPETHTRAPTPLVEDPSAWDWIGGWTLQGDAPVRTPMGQPDRSLSEGAERTVRSLSDSNPNPNPNPKPSWTLRIWRHARLRPLNEQTGSSIDPRSASLEEKPSSEGSHSSSLSPSTLNEQASKAFPAPSEPVAFVPLGWTQALELARQQQAQAKAWGARRLYQPLLPQPGGGSSEALTPEAMAYAMERLRTRLQQSEGDLSRALPFTLGAGMPPLSSTLTPEQQDSLLLMLRAARQRAGFIIADETGFGKGRSLAAMMLCALETGSSAVFFTERRQLFSDIWRDFVAVAGPEKAQQLLPRLLILHPKGRIYGPQGELIARAPMPKAMKALLQHGTAHGHLNGQRPLITLTCYSQLNRVSKSHPRLSLLRTLVSGAALCLDEAHNAAGDSNTGENVEQLIKLSASCVFSSATFAKTEAALSFYAKALPIPRKELTLLTEGFAGDGQKALASALAGALAETGRIARREHAFEGVAQSQTLELSGTHRIRALSAMEKLAEALRTFFVFLDAAEQAKSRALSQDKESPWLKMGAILGRLCRQHLLLCKIEAAADCAAQSAKDGRKSVFALESTFGAFLSALENGSLNAAQEQGDDDVLESVSDDSDPETPTTLSKMTSFASAADSADVEEEENGAKAGAGAEDSDPALEEAVFEDDSRLDPASVFDPNALHPSPEFESREPRSSARPRSSEDGGSPFARRSKSHLSISSNVTAIVPVSVSPSPSKAPMQGEPQATPVFGDLFAMAVEMACPSDEPMFANDPQVVLAREAVLQAAKHLEPFLASPLDALREALAARGLSCGEVSGRARRLIRSDNGGWSFAPVPAQPRERTVWQFNHGELDCLIITRAGSTGISAHSDPSFADQRGRDFYELELAPNAAERVQFLGRVRRRGQVNAPRYFALSSGVAFERRHLERQAQKLSKLARITSGAEASAGELDLVEELMSPAGEAAAREWLMAHADSARLLGIDIWDKRRVQSVCEKLLKRVILLDEPLQEDALAFITRACGIEHDAQTRAHAGLWALNGSVLTRRELLWGATAPERGPFEPALWLCERLERPRPRPLSARQASEALAAALNTHADTAAQHRLLDQVWAEHRDWIGRPGIGQQWRWIRDVVPQLGPGLALRIADPADRRPTHACVESIQAPVDTRDVAFPSQWRIRLLLPQTGERLDISLARFRSEAKVNWKAARISPQELGRAFVQEERKPVRRRLTLEGHAAYAQWWSARFNLGRWGFFQDSLGLPRGALALPEGSQGFERFLSLPLPLLDSDQVLAQLRLEPNTAIHSHWNPERAGCQILVGHGEFWLAIDKAHLSTVDDFQLARRFDKNSRTFETLHGRDFLIRRAEIRWLRPVLSMLRSKGVFFFASTAQREWHMRHFAALFGSSASGGAGGADDGGQEQVSAAKRAARGARSVSRGGTRGGRKATPTAPPPRSRTGPALT